MTYRGALPTGLVAGILVAGFGCGPARPARDAASAAGATAAPAGFRYEQHVFAGGVAPLGAEAPNPFVRDTSSVGEGARLFVSMNCSGCHGDGATGSWAPSLSDGRWRYGGADGAIFQSIYYGRPGGMPAFGGILQPAIVWKLVTYLKSLPPPRAVPTQAW